MAENLPWRRYQPNLDFTLTSTLPLHRLHPYPDIILTQISSLHEFYHHRNFTLTRIYPNSDYALTRILPLFLFIPKKRGEIRMKSHSVKILLRVNYCKGESIMELGWMKLGWNLKMRLNFDEGENFCEIFWKKTLNQAIIFPIFC